MGSTDNQVPAPSNDDNEAVVDALLFSGSIAFPMILKAANELDLFSILAKAGPGAHISASEVASQLPAKGPDAASMLDRMLRLFTAYSLLTCSSRTLGDGGVEMLYGLTPTSKYFVQSSDVVSLFHVSDFVFHPAVMQVWLQIKDAILEGGDLFQRIHGMSFFQFMSSDSSFNAKFNRSMAAISKIAMKGIVDAYKGYEGLTSLVDVGGGTGGCLHTVISKYPSIKGINFDLPHVTQTAPPYPGIEHVGGDMFSGVPAADAIMMKNVLHDWDDENCVKLIKNCYEALPTKGKLIILTTMLPETPEPTKASKFVYHVDNCMSFVSPGKERTAKEFEALCKKSGFSNFQIVCLVHGLWAVIECYK